MKKIIIILLLVYCIGIIAQESNDSTFKIKEISISTSSLSYLNFGFQYKKQVGNSTLLRIGLLNIQAQRSVFDPGDLYSFTQTQTNLGCDFQIGLEKRKLIDDRLILFYGIDLVGSFHFERTGNNNPSFPESLRHRDQIVLGPGFAFNSGFMIKLKNNFYFSSEISPRIIFSYRVDDTSNPELKNKTYNGSFNFNLSNVKVSFIYRLHKT